MLTENLYCHSTKNNLWIFKLFLTHKIWNKWHFDHSTHVPLILISYILLLYYTVKEIMLSWTIFWSFNSWNHKTVKFSYSIWSFEGTIAPSARTRFHHLIVWATAAFLAFILNTKFIMTFVFSENHLNSES